MARWADVIEVEKKLRLAVAERDVWRKEADDVLAYIRETGQADAYLEWFARRMGLHQTLYGTDEQKGSIDG